MTFVFPHNKIISLAQVVAGPVQPYWAESWSKTTFYFLHCPHASKINILSFFPLCYWRHPWYSGSRSDCWPTGHAIDPAPGAWFMSKFISFTQVVSGPVQPDSAESWLKTPIIPFVYHFYFLYLVNCIIFLCFREDPSGSTVPIVKQSEMKTTKTTKKIS